MLVGGCFFRATGRTYGLMGKRGGGQGKGTRQRGEEGVKVEPQGEVGMGG